MRNGISDWSVQDQTVHTAGDEVAELGTCNESAEKLHAQDVSMAPTGRY